LQHSLTLPRIFYPKGFNAKSQKKLPTILSIHGGGFVVGNPRDDDLFNYNFANMHSVMVVALNYTKAPRARFPTPTYDLEQLILAVLSDSSLPIDKDRVAMMGASAGGNLALSVSILPSMCGSGDGVRRIKTLIPLYPVVDMSVRREYKTQTRQYKPSLGGFRANPVDYLLRLSPVFDAAYTLAGQDLQDPLLSPIYASKEQLPPNIFLLGIELDMLANESWRMICGLSGHEVGRQTVGHNHVSPPGKLVLDDERFSFEVKKNDGNYRWLLVPDQIHGYDHYDSLELLHGDKELSKDAELKTVEAQKLIGKWLFEGPFA
jgi:acetyl esterase/lipase